MTDIEVLNIIDTTCSDRDGRVYVNLIKKNNDLYNYLLTRYKDSDSLKETIFRIRNGIEIRPTCVLCGGKVKFDEHVSHHYMRNHGFYWHCSSKCSKNDKEVRDKIKETCLERYGDEHNWGKHSSVRSKCAETFKKNYDTQEKLDELFEKRSKTKMEHYGDPNYNNREKFKRTNLERYGVEYYYNTEKCRKTKQERYGDSNYNNASKMLETKMERYGNLCPGIEKARATMFERYGVQYYFQHQDCIKKSHTLEIKLKANQTRCKNGTNRKSHLETMIRDFISENYPMLLIEENKRKYLDGFEIDVYLPELKLGFEIQGDYFHANPLFYKCDDIVLGIPVKDIWEKDKKKLKLANKKGIMLLQLWEHDIKEDFNTICKKISEQINAHL